MKQMKTINQDGEEIIVKIYHYNIIIGFKSERVFIERLYLAGKLISEKYYKPPINIGKQKCKSSETELKYKMYSNPSFIYRNPFQLYNKDIV